MKTEKIRLCTTTDSDVSSYKGEQWSVDVTYKEYYLVGS
jgi:hypothetical protein